MLKTLRERFRSPDSFVSLILGLAVVFVVGTLVYNYATKRVPQMQKAAEEKKLAQEQMTLPATHTVAAGETLWSIAETYYKSGYNWVDIQKANNLGNANLIEAGQTLTIPEAPVIAPPGQISEGTSTVAPKDASYTVVKGDTLWSIAVAQYGDGYQWSKIAQANSLANPDLIHAGNVLTLP